MIEPGSYEEAVAQMLDICTYCELTVDRDGPQGEVIGQFHDNARCIKEGQLFKRHPAEQVFRQPEPICFGPSGFTGWVVSLTERMAAVTAAVEWKWENDPELREEWFTDAR